MYLANKDAENNKNLWIGQAGQSCSEMPGIGKNHTRQERERARREMLTSIEIEVINAQ